MAQPDPDTFGERIAGRVGRATGRLLVTLHAPRPICEVVKRVVLGLLLLGYWIAFPIRFPVRVVRGLSKPT